ncbi:MAG: SpoIVB peptidase S55 domain-containing protein [Anaeroplasma sp.]
MKKFKRIILLVLIIILLYIPINVFAYDLSKDDKIYVGGQAIGIRLRCGVEVVGTYGIEVNGKVYKPWSKCGLLEGDYIVSINNCQIEDKEDILTILSSIGDSTVDITYRRNQKEFTSTITPVKTEDGYSLGLYIKDSILGVGTLTYYVKEANIYGSLGHKITDSDFYSGEIYEAKVIGIKYPTRNEAGEKKATISGDSIGNVEKNTNTGVQGNANANFNYSNMTLLPFKTQNEIVCGDAEIWTCIEGTLVEKFSIRITSLEKQNKKDIKGIEFEVTDKNLISKTGGIVQGMSGSPIIQDGAIIGAVTHVSLKDSTHGYGIYLEWMFEDMGINILD